MLLVDRKRIPVAEPALGKSGLQFRNFQQWADEMRSVSDSRVNTRELKAQIVKKIGAKRAESYFSHVRKFLSSQLSKDMLDKLVIITIGRQNVALHNQLIKSILTNAVLCCGAPPDAISSIDHHVSNQRKHRISFNNGPSALDAPSSTHVSLSSPHHKMSNALVDRYGEDKEGKLNTSRKEHVICKQRKHNETKQIFEQDDETMSSKKRLKVNNSFSAKIPHTELNSESLSSPTIEAPLGIAFCKNDVHKRCCSLQPLPAHLLAQDVTEEEFSDLVSLPDSESMHKIIEQIAVAEALAEVGGDCAEVLNRALDSYLKGLITSCVEFVRSGTGRTNHQKPVRNCTSRGNNNKDDLRSGSELLQGPLSTEILQAERSERNNPLSLTDFKMAMEFMPHQLGASWPVQLERISFRIYDH